MIDSSSLRVQFYPLLGPPHLNLDLLTCPKDLKGLQVQVIPDCGVYKIWAHKTVCPRFKQAGQRHMRPKTRIQSSDRLEYVLLTVAKIGSQS